MLTNAQHGYKPTAIISNRDWFMLDTTNHCEQVFDKRHGTYLGTIERYIEPDYVHAHDATIGNEQDGSYGYLASAPTGETYRWRNAQTARGWLLDIRIGHDHKAIKAQRAQALADAKRKPRKRR